ncbi:MAG: DUF2721 domain-containing protein [Bacteroidota bacterium]
MEFENWVFPLTILPGIGLMIASTTSWSVALTNEINQLFERIECDREILGRKIRQLKLINNALVSLYVSVGMCTLSGFVGSIWNASTMASDGIIAVTILVAIGIAFLLVGAGMLIVYAFRAVRIKQDQFVRRL